MIIIIYFQKIGQFCIRLQFISIYDWIQNVNSNIPNVINKSVAQIILFLMNTAKINKKGNMKRRRQTLTSWSYSRKTLKLTLLRSMGCAASRWMNTSCIATVFLKVARYSLKAHHQTKSVKRPPFFSLKSKIYTILGGWSSSFFCSLMVRCPHSTAILLFHLISSIVPLQFCRSEITPFY